LGQEHLSNDDINKILLLKDLITDEYGNYYSVVEMSNKGQQLAEVTLSHFYYERAFAIIVSDDFVQEYTHKHIGCFLQDELSKDIEMLQDQHRTIFSIQDLIQNGTKIHFLDLTALHPRGK
jgi:hypothetical protein